MKYFLYFSMLTVILNSCLPDSNEPPKSTPVYIIKGRVINGTTQAVRNNRNLDFEWINNNKKSGELGSAKTDGTGYFSFSYHLAGEGPHPVLKISAPDFQLDNVPLNRDIDSTFYLSTMGTLKISLNTKNPLLSNDTLFFGITNSNTGETVIDTITKINNGYYKTIRVRPPTKGLRWGRGIKDFAYNKTTGHFYNGGHDIGVHITGDPYVDSITINY